MDRIKPFAARLGALVVLSSLATLGPAAVGSAAGADALLSRAAHGRTPRRVASVQVLGVAEYLLTVGSMERSVAFYRDVIGLPLLRAPERGVANALEQSLTDTPGARFRSAVFSNPGVGPALVLEEFTGIPHRTLRPRAVDPGAATVEISVRDLAPVLAAAARAGNPIVTRGGRALSLDRDATREIVLRDPDGFYVHLSQLPITPGTGALGSGASNVRALRMQYTVAAPAAIVRFYHVVLGLPVHAGPFVRDGSVSELFDTGRAQRALLEISPPGRSGAADAAAADGVLQFVAFRGIPRHTYGGRPQDAGTPAVALRVKDLTSALRAIRASGTIIVSAGGQPVLTGHGGASILVRDPAGLLVQLIQEPVPPRQ